jgi:hypothetical protein
MGCIECDSLQTTLGVRPELEVKDLPCCHGRHVTPRGAMRDYDLDDELPGQAARVISFLLSALIINNEDSLHIQPGRPNNRGPQASIV